MKRRESGHWMIQGFFAAAILLVLFVSGIPQFLMDRACGECHGSGFIHLPRLENPPNPEEPYEYFCGNPSRSTAGIRRCSECREGRIPMTAAVLEKEFPRLLLGVWECVCILVAAALVLSLRLIECRLCGGAGGLALEVTSPGEVVTVIEDACFVCEGRGRLTVIDRWVE